MISRKLFSFIVMVIFPTVAKIEPFSLIERQFSVISELVKKYMAKRWAAQN